MTDKTEIIEVETVKPLAVQQTGALAANSPAAIMLQAISQGTDLAQIEKMMDLQDRWERKEAEKAYNAAFANFKAEAVRIIKAKEVTAGPLSGKSYAELHDVVHAVTPALSRHGLSASWKLTKDEPMWLEVTCTLKHVDGHSESVSMGGPPDAGGAKNALQARASTKTYLERYTLKAVCGVAEGGDDTDGDYASPDVIDETTQGWIDYANANRHDKPAFDAACKKARAAFNEARNTHALRQFNEAVK